MGPHIFQTCPSANYFDCKAMSIGARSQSARTYLERHMDTFFDCEYFLPFLLCFWCKHIVKLSFCLVGELNDLVQHGLRGLRETLPAEQDLTTKVNLKLTASSMETQDSEHSAMLECRFLSQKGRLLVIPSGIQHTFLLPENFMRRIILSTAVVGRVVAWFVDPIYRLLIK